MRGPVNFLLLALPAAVASWLSGALAWMTLAAAAAALVPLAAWIATATEHLARRVGAGLGGFLNASLANTIDAVEPVTRAFGLSERFLGLILIPLLGNIAEQFAAVSFARENRLNLSLSIAANSSTQIAVFVAPLLVLVSRFFHPMDLVFRPIELMTLFGSTGIFGYISLDGESNWLEGAQLIARYLIVAVVFFLPR